MHDRHNPSTHPAGVEHPDQPKESTPQSNSKPDMGELALLDLDALNNFDFDEGGGL